jgi:hypothetical protein
VDTDKIAAVSWGEGWGEGRRDSESSSLLSISIADNKSDTPGTSIGVLPARGLETDCSRSDQNYAASLCDLPARSLSGQPSHAATRKFEASNSTCRVPGMIMIL